MSIASQSKYGVTLDWTPIFNTDKLPFLNLPLQKDTQGRLLEMETIAFPGTVLKIVQHVSAFIAQIETVEYPSSIPLYVDRRFLKDASEKTPARTPHLPTTSLLLQWLKDRVGTRYFWGGNCHRGIARMLQFYPHLKKASQDDLDDALCRGVDCSGLLFEATQGLTPRNTSCLTHYGHDLKLHNCPLDQIQKNVQPLDLIVWRGHILIVLSPTELLESRIGHGVVITDFATRYCEVVERLKVEQKPHFFRRWHPETAH